MIDYFSGFGILEVRRHGAGYGIGGVENQTMSILDDMVDRK